MGLSAAIVSGLDAWKAIYDSVEPQNETLPAPWSTRLDGFQKILVLRLLRPDKVGRAEVAEVAEGESGLCGRDKQAQFIILGKASSSPDPS